MANQDFLGEHSEFLGGNLRSLIESGGMSEALKQMLSTGEKRIGRGRRRATEDVAIAGAQSGFKGTGVNTIADIFESEAIASGELTAGIGQQADVNVQQALAQLMGLTQFQGQQELGGARLSESERQFSISSRDQREQFMKMFGLKERELELAEEASGFGLGDIFGSLAGIATGGVASGFGDFLGKELFS